MVCKSLKFSLNFFLFVPVTQSTCDGDCMISKGSSSIIHMYITVTSFTVYALSLKKVGVSIKMLGKFNKFNQSSLFFKKVFRPHQ